MAHFDSLGNRYDSLPSRKYPPKAKPTTDWKSRQARKSDQPNSKYNRYRREHGGVGNKAGKNKV